MTSTQQPSVRGDWPHDTSPLDQARAHGRGSQAPEIEQRCDLLQERGHRRRRLRLIPADAPRQPDLDDANSREDPPDVPGSQAPVDETVQLVRRGNNNILVFVLQAEQELAAAPEAKRLRHPGPGAVRADEKARRAVLAEVEAVPPAFGPLPA